MVGNSKLTNRARALRRDQTDAEAVLWRHLRDRQLDGHKIRRQCPLGDYVVDFFCMEQKLIIEVDGGQHAWRKAQDDKRTAWLENEGYRVVRFWNNDVLQNVEGVLTEISNELRCG